MKCNPKGNFCYTHKVDNKRENSGSLNIDLDLFAELTVDAMLAAFFQRISNDPKCSRLFSKSQILEIQEGLATWSVALDAMAGSVSTMPDFLISLLEPLFILLQIQYAFSQAQAPSGGWGNGCGSVNFEQLTAAIMARFNIMLKLNLAFSGSNTKEAHGTVKQEVNVSWNFCDAPTIKGCCGTSGPK